MELKNYLKDLLGDQEARSCLTQSQLERTS